MDEVLELCRRVLGDGDQAEQAATEARAEQANDRIALLAAAARACRKRTENENGRSATEPRADASGRLADAVAQELASATARLPEREREALALRELLRLSYEQISGVMGLETSAIAPLLAHARLRLRAERRGSVGASANHTCAEHERSLRILACRQDSEPLSHEDDEWVLAHLVGCPECATAHAAMLEASVCYRAWP